MTKIKIFFKNTLEFLKRIGLKFLEFKTWKKLLILFFTVVLGYCIFNLPTWVTSASFKAVNLDKYRNEKQELVSGTEIKIGIEELLITENAKYQMYLNTRTTNVTIVSKLTNEKWTTIVEDVSSLLGEEKNFAQSNLIVEYINLQQKTDSVNSFQHSIESSDYTLEKINNGVRINYTLLKSEITLTYFPLKISEERMQEKILSNPNLTESDLVVINRVYSFMTSEGYYLRANTAQKNVRKELYRIFYEVCGYTETDLAIDAEMFYGEVQTISLPKFEISLELTLDKDGLKASVPTYAISEAENYFISKISVLPYLGADKNDQDGYILIPDGSGALMKYNDFNSSDYHYYKQVYDNDRFLNSGYIYNRSNSEEITLPVFGLINETANTAVMGVITNGGELANIYGSSSGYMNYIYNRANTTFCHYIYDNVGLYNPYDGVTVRLQIEEPLYFDYQLKYYFLEDEQASYYGMAKKYQEYLIEEYQLTKSYDDEPSLAIDIVGSVSVDTNIVGIPYRKSISLTTFEEAEEIIKDLKLQGITNIKLNYNGWFNEGLNQTSVNRTNIIASVERELKLNEFLMRMKELDVDVSFATNITKIYGNNKNGFISNNHSIKLMDNDIFTFYGYSQTTGKLDYSMEGFYYLSPKYVLSQVQSVNNFFNTQNIENISLNDLGNSYLADYSRSNFISPLMAKQMIIEGLDSLNGKKITMSNPFDYSIQFSSYLTNIDYQSSNLYCFYCTIPFKQLVYNGLINYTTSDINNGTVDFSNKGYLKALETGSDMKYIFTYQPSSLLKDTDYNYLYATQYSAWKSEVVSIYNKYNHDYQQIGTRRIVNHQALSKDVFQVTYETGVKVIFNYSDRAFIYNGITIEANQNHIMNGGQ